MSSSFYLVTKWVARKYKSLEYKMKEIDNKRKAGLLKKAYELSILCDVDIAVIMITQNNKLYQYASSNMNTILIRYTEFKDPDESKTNADILEDITKKEKNGRGEDSGEEEDGAGQIPLTPNTQAHYQRIDEEFDHVLHHPAEIPQTHQTAIPPPLIIPSKVPQSMPVSVPVSSSGGGHRLSSTGSSDSPVSSTTPGSAKTPHSNMPPPSSSGTPPTRLQTIRSQTLKLHLPGGGRNYIQLGSGSTPSKSPMDDTNTTVGGGVHAPVDKEHYSSDTEVSVGRPQLRVVIPGQKGFVPRTVPSSPPIAVGMSAEEDTPTTPPVIVDATDSPPPTTQSLATKSVSTHTLPAHVNTDSLTTPIMSLTTPNIFSSLPPGLSNFSVDIPNLGETGSTSALVAFPVSIQPSSINNTPGTGNIILQAQNMGQPFLLTQTSHEKQSSASSSSSGAGGVASSFTPTSVLSTGGTGGGVSSLRDLEQLKLQYDKIYQQISQTLQQHQATFSQSNISKDMESVVGEKRVRTSDTVSEIDASERNTKRLHVETATD